MYNILSFFCTAYIWSIPVLTYCFAVSFFHWIFFTTFCHIFFFFLKGKASLILFLFIYRMPTKCIITLGFGTYEIGLCLVFSLHVVAPSVRCIDHTLYIFTFLYIINFRKWKWWPKFFSLKFKLFVTLDITFWPFSYLLETSTVFSTDTFNWHTFHSIVCVLSCVIKKLI